MKYALILLSLALILLLPRRQAIGQVGASGYHIVDSLKLGGEGGWDYLTVDSSAERIYISRGTRVQVVDLRQLAIVGEIPDTRGVHGVALVPAQQRGYTSNGRDSSVTVFDLGTLKTISTIKIKARNPDAILYDPFSGRIFTFNGASFTATVIDTGDNSIVANIPLGGKPEFAVTDGRGQIFVNLEDKSEIVALDTKTLKILRRWPLAPGEGPTGLSIDRENRRLFTGCTNRLLIVSDPDGGRAVAKLPIGDGVDGTAYDPGLGLAFSSNGEGTITVIREETPERFTVVDNVRTRRSARTMAIDERTHRLYTVAGRYGLPSVETNNRVHPTLVAGSVTLYVLSR